MFRLDLGVGEDGRLDGDALGTEAGPALRQAQPLAVCLDLGSFVIGSAPGPRS
jgi:hypothetical protein